MFTEANGVKSEWFFAMGHKLKQNSITNDIMSSNQHWYIATHTILYSVCLVDHFSTLPTLPVATPLVSLACQSGRLPTPNLSASKTRLPSNRTLSSWKTRYWTSGNHAELRMTHGWVSASYNIYIYIHFSIQYLLSVVRFSTSPKKAGRWTSEWLISGSDAKKGVSLLAWDGKTTEYN